MDDAVARLRDIANVRLTDAARNSFKRLSDVRNKLQHFGLVQEETGVEILAGEVLDALLVFIGEHLELGARADEQEPLREARELIREEITRISALVKARMQLISSELKDKAHFIVACPGCIQLTLELGEEGNPDVVCSANANGLIRKNLLAATPRLSFTGVPMRRQWATRRSPLVSAQNAIWKRWLMM